MATAGDLLADGYADVIVGAKDYDSHRGRAYVYLGEGGGLQATPALTLTGESPLGNFGASVAAAGDVNGDGYVDLAIGAPGASGVFIYNGGVRLSATPSITLTGENSGDSFGASVAAAGDVNGDGYADVIVGAKDYGGQQGRAYLYLGAAEGLQATPALTLTGASAGNSFGASAATAGDVNGDGYADFVVGAPGAGQAYVYAGGAALQGTPAITLVGGNPGDQFGSSVATAGDVNGDGFSDIIVGASADSANQGRAYIYLGGSAGLEAGAALTLSGESPDSFFGAAVAPAGDVDGDGFGDLLVGAYAYNQNRGRAYLHRGNGGGGRSVLAQAERPADGLVVQPWALTRSASGFKISLAATDPLGRGRVKLQTQICPPGAAFSGLGCSEQTSSLWQDVAASPTITLTVTDLAPSTLYRWRARVLYAPYSVTTAGEPPNPAHGPWRRFLAQSQEADVHTGPLYWLRLPLVLR